MATRLSVITTRSGDAGTTGLGDGSRVSKSAPRVAALGEVDELNSTIGLWRTEALPQSVDQILGRVQHDLFDLGAELSIPGHSALRQDHVEFLETTLTEFNASLGPLQEFILPGGTRGAALAHVSRSVCRRAERAVITLELADGPSTVSEPARLYLNRLSDLCFVLARWLNKAAGETDVLWKRG